MYYKNFVVAIKTGGKILKDHKGEVLLPFKSEYSLVLKNLNSVRACASISIDGRDVLDGKRIIVPANSSVELERFLDGCDNSGHKFKFIEMTDKIAAHRGETIDDGIVRVEFWFEQPLFALTTTYWDNSFTPYISYTRPRVYDNVNTTATFPDHVVSSTSCYANVARQASFTYDSGITVSGAESKQGFQTGHIGTLESTSSVIVIRLAGEHGAIKVTKPVTRTSTIECNTCGTRNKSWYSYCNECGNNLH
jgi:hypothetical protein